MPPTDLFDEELLERSNATELRQYLREARHGAKDVIALLGEGAALLEELAIEAPLPKELSDWLNRVRELVGEPKPRPPVEPMPDASGTTSGPGQRARK